MSVAATSGPELANGRLAWQASVAREPWRFDVLTLLRRLEAAQPAAPRLGRSATMAQEIAIPRQDPFLEFPSCNITQVAFPQDAPCEVHVQFMGYFGPQGALPLPLSAEAHQWLTRHNDPSFARFADIFSTRFVQLFYRAWADARPEVQMDRPGDDRFRVWLGSLIGLGSPATRNRDGVPDDTRLGLAGLLSGRVRSATRLRQSLDHLLGMPLELEERVGTWLDFDPADCSRLGLTGSTLGQDICLGTRAFSLNDKLRLVLHCRDLDEYHAFLPGQPDCHRLLDFLHSALGMTIETDIVLTLPQALVPPTVLGQAGNLGWTAFSLNPEAPTDPASSAAISSDRRRCAVYSANAHHAALHPRTPTPDRSPTHV